MTLSYDMYPAKNNSPITVLTADLNSSDSVMTVENARVLPDAPNLAVIGSSENAEIVLYTAKNGNNITIRRGFNNTVAGVWTTGTPVARNFTAYDHDTFIANIRDLENLKQDTLTFDTEPTAESTNPVTSGGIKTALDAKQDELTFDSTPTSNSINPVTSCGVKSYVDSHDDFKITGIVSSSGYTLTDSRINDEHWEVDWIQFLTPTNVLTSGNWTTDIVNHMVTLSATYSGSTNVVVNMHWVQ